MNLFPKLFTLSKRFIRRTKHGTRMKDPSNEIRISLGTECRDSQIHAKSSVYFYDYAEA